MMTTTAERATDLRPASEGAGPMPVLVVPAAQAGPSPAAGAAREPEAAPGFLPWSVLGEKSAGAASPRRGRRGVSSRSAGSQGAVARRAALIEHMQAVRLDWEILRRLVADETQDLVAVYCEKIAARCALVREQRWHGTCWDELLNGLRGDLEWLAWWAQKNQPSSPRTARPSGCSHGSSCCHPECHLQSAARRCVECHRQYGGPGRAL